MSRNRKQGWPYEKEFRCHRCGNCCRGDGFVELTTDDARRAAAYLGMEHDEFVEAYCFRNKAGDLVLKDQEDEEQSCIFLTGDEQGLSGCRIHGAKPEQCAAFPMRWRPRDVAAYCEGMRAVLGLAPGTKRRKVSG